MSNLFIIDGVDGAGKTTVALLLENIIRCEHKPIAQFRAFNTGPITQAIRTRVIDSFDPPKNTAEAIYGLASHMELLNDYVYPAVAEGKTVILDRGLGSYFAYQHWANKNPDAYDLWEQFLVPAYTLETLKPLYIWCDAKLDVAESRINSRKDPNARDLEDAVYKESAREGFEKVFQMLQMDKLRLDTSKSSNETASALIKAVVWNTETV